MQDLSNKHCVPCAGGIEKITPEKAQTLLKNIEGWEIDKAGLMIGKTYCFKNYYQTMAFVNLVAWISHQENHHPDMRISYNACEVQYTTHAINGLSENDFICASKINKLKSS
jgi:4a-hydroxytetrahydrobiopterin dehydratase